MRHMSKEEFVTRMLQDIEKRQLLEREKERRADFEVTDYIGQSIAKREHKKHRRKRH